MKTRFFLLAALLCVFSCTSLKEEWEPVFTLSYDSAAEFTPVNMDSQVNCTIAQLKSLYTTHGKPVQITDNLIIKGQVTTSDEDGNVYREIYIQDETGAIGIKLGKSSSYDDYKVGQILYVNCYSLVVGEYGYKSGSYGGSGLLQLGYIGDGWSDYLSGVSTEIPDYEAAYLDLQTIINKHIFRGSILSEEERIKPTETLSGSYLSSDSFKNNIADVNVGKLVKLNNVSYGNSVGGKEIFCLFYPDPSLNHSKNESWNRVFLASDQTRVSGKDYSFGITTWALTKNRFKILASAGTWDDVEIGDGSGTIGTALTKEEYFGYVAPYKQVIIEHPGAQSVSHYFMYDGTEVQVRTSGYCRFADVEIPADVRSGSKTLDITGILSRYQGSPQFTILDVTYHGQSESLIK